MGRTIQELGESMSVDELMLWREYLYTTPSESEKLRYQIASHTTLYANMNSKKNYEISDFLLSFSEKKEKTQAVEVDDFRAKNKQVKADLLKQIQGMI